MATARGRTWKAIVFVVESFVWENYLVFALITGAVLLCLAWILMVLQRDAWPLSCYPMFSQPMYPETLAVYRIAFEYPDGSLRWWHSEFHKLQQTLGPQLFSCVMSTKPQQVARLDEVLRLIQSVSREDPEPPAVHNLCIVLRQCHPEGGGWAIHDEIVARIRLSESKQNAR